MNTPRIKRNADRTPTEPFQPPDSSMPTVMPSRNTEATTCASRCEMWNQARMAGTATLGVVPDITTGKIPIISQKTVKNRWRGPPAAARASSSCW